ncbi:SynChlorMet cassette protein ScmD [Candidatus Pacearchaeota archaeon]|nr:SynChlorMet cassette protein ScmD [Candidatus Pacearchaeota archaeon]
MSDIINVRYAANSLALFCEKSDDWSILLDPDTGEDFSLNPVSTFIWKLLDGTRTVHEITHELHNTFNCVPDNAKEYVTEFIHNLVKLGLAGCEIEHDL